MGTTNGLSTMETSSFDSTTITLVNVDHFDQSSNVILAFTIDFFVSITLLAFITCFIRLALQSKRTFLSVAIKLMKIRSRMKKSRWSLDEFVCACQVLGISQKQVTDVYTEMHRHRREDGEAWLYGETPRRRLDKESKKAATTKNKPRRKLPIFQSFAANSQFTQGFDEYRMHHLLHAVRSSEHQSQDIPEAATFYQITELCSTMRKEPSEVANEKKATVSITMPSKATPPPVASAVPPKKTNKAMNRVT